jgi:hypothetical protein
MRVRGQARPLLAVVVAIAVGVVAAVIDTIPHFDDTGVLAVGLLLGGALAAVVAGRVRAPWLVVLVIAAGFPVPIAEIAGGGSAAAFAATLFAAIGVTVGAIAARAASPRPSPIH